MALVAKGHGPPGSPPRDLQQDLTRTRALIAGLEQRMHEFVRVSLNSWEGDSYASRQGTLRP